MRILWLSFESNTLHMWTVYQNEKAIFREYTTVYYNIKGFQCWKFSLSILLSKFPVYVIRLLIFIKIVKCSLKAIDRFKIILI